VKTDELVNQKRAVGSSRSLVESPTFPSAFWVVHVLFKRKMARVGENPNQPQLAIRGGGAGVIMAVY